LSTRRGTPRWNRHGDKLQVRQIQLFLFNGFFKKSVSEAAHETAKANTRKLNPSYDIIKDSDSECPSKNGKVVKGKIWNTSRTRAGQKNKTTVGALLPIKT
jgi:hypothetical protein